MLFWRNPTLLHRAAAALLVGTLATMSAAAAETPVLSGKRSSSVGTVLTAGEINNAAKAAGTHVSVSTAGTTVTTGNAATDPEIEGIGMKTDTTQQPADGKVDPETAAEKPAKPAQTQSSQAASTTKPISQPTKTHTTAGARTVAFSQSLLASDVIKRSSVAKGQCKLSFYCPCAICNGKADGLTASGTALTEGRTIAVDSSIIPLGSRVYIDGYGLFIAEDRGGLIAGNRIDIAVSNHERALSMGIKYANVYVMH